MNVRRLFENNYLQMGRVGENLTQLLPTTYLMATPPVVVPNVLLNKNCSVLTACQSIYPYRPDITRLMKT